MNEHIAAEMILLEAEREIDRLRAENAALETRLKRLRKREGIRKELSVLEISAMAMQGMLASGDIIFDIPNNAKKYANALIAAVAKEAE
jgi:cell division protein FtsB